MRFLNWTFRCAIAVVLVNPDLGMALTTSQNCGLSRNRRGRRITIYDVVIVGAGAAGLTAAYELGRRKADGVTFRLLEANPETIGGRIRKTESFATDFPLDLGAGWIHENPTILDKIVNDRNVVVDKSNVISYNPNYSYYWGPDQEWISEAFSSVGDNDHSFVDSTWFDFFNEYIAPQSVNDLELGCVVTNISSKTNPGMHVVTCDDGRSFLTKNVIVTTSIAVLQRGDIVFDPPLPDYKIEALAKVKMDPGLKAIFKFSSKFYRDAFDVYQTQAEENYDGDRFFFDDTYGETTDENILGLFLRGQQAEAYIELSDEAIRDKILGELDRISGGQASKFYLDHIITNWSKEPYVGGVYSNHDWNDSYDSIELISRPVDGIYFAGEALQIENGYAHGAALSGQRVANEILKIIVVGRSASVWESLKFQQHAGSHLYSGISSTAWSTMAEVHSRNLLQIMTLMAIVVLA